MALAMLTGLGAPLLPFGTESSIDANGVGASEGVSLLSSEGPGVLVIVAIPALLVGLPLLLRGESATFRARVVIVVLLGALVILGAASIGLFFVPTLIAMALSVSADSSARSAAR